MVEEWRPYPELPEYEVSTYGRIRSYRNRQGHPQDAPRIMTPCLVRGYLKINLRDRQARVHLMVLETFVGSRPENQVARHLDGNPLNNHADNLAWGTLSENYDDRRRHGTHNTGSRHGLAKLHEDDIPTIRTLISSGSSDQEVAERFNMSKVTISRIRRGVAWTHVP